MYKEHPVDFYDLTRILFLRLTCCQGTGEDTKSYCCGANCRCSDIFCNKWKPRLQEMPTCWPGCSEKDPEGGCVACSQCFLGGMCSLAFPLACLTACTTAAYVRSMKKKYNIEYPGFPYYLAPRRLNVEQEGVHYQIPPETWRKHPELSPKELLALTRREQAEEEQKIAQLEKRALERFRQEQTTLSPGRVRFENPMYDENRAPTSSPHPERQQQPRRTAGTGPNPHPGVVTSQPRLQQPTSSAPVKKVKASSQMIRNIPSKDIKFMPEQALGSGAFGLVYRGKWGNTDVAIKQLKDGLQSADTKEFYQEAKMLAKTQHPHIVILYGAVTDKNPNCLVMELMTESLFDILHDKEHKLPWKKKKGFGLDIAQGLNFLHDRKVLHRDLKSRNVLADRAGHLKLADFGLARVVAEATRRLGAYIGDATGTITHMAPELFALQAKYTEFSDVYAYAMTLWEVASRKIPYQDAAHQQVIIAQVSNGMRETVTEKTPQVMRQIIEGGWAAEPEDRPMLSTIIQELNASLQQKPPSASSTPSSHMRSNPNFAGNFDSVATSASGSHSSSPQFANNFDSEK